MDIERIEGIGPKYAQELKKVGVETTNQLLELGASKKGRQELAEKSGISEKLVLEWVNLADLMRVEGVGEEYADLLEEAGVDSVKELRNRRADNLHEAMLKTNDAKNLVRRPPSLNEVEKWVEQAKSLPPIITH